MEYIRGSAVGVRIAGSLFGAGGAFISIVGAWGGTNWWIVLPFVSFFLYLLVRPWFMGVWIGDNTVAIQSWFRKYSFARGEVQSIDLEPLPRVGCNLADRVGSVRRANKNACC